MMAEIDKNTKVSISLVAMFFRFGSSTFCCGGHSDYQAFKTSQQLPKFNILLRYGQSKKMGKIEIC